MSILAMFTNTGIVPRTQRRAQQFLWSPGERSMVPEGSGSPAKILSMWWCGGGNTPGASNHASAGAFDLYAEGVASQSPQGRASPWLRSADPTSPTPRGCITPMQPFEVDGALVDSLSTSHGPAVRGGRDSRRVTQRSTGRVQWHGQETTPRSSPFSTRLVTRSCSGTELLEANRPEKAPGVGRQEKAVRACRNFDLRRGPRSLEVHRDHVPSEDYISAW